MVYSSLRFGIHDARAAYNATLFGKHASRLARGKHVRVPTQWGSTDAPTQCGLVMAFACDKKA
jgi:hypothetical protein